MNAKLMSEIATTDSTFSLEEGRWRGKCLICNGWLSFDAQTGFGANIEHIVPRSLGGDNALLNLGLTHPRCNGEKGRRWDPKRRHRAAPDRYQALVQALLRRRQERWRERVTSDEWRRTSGTACGLSRTLLVTRYSLLITSLRP